MIRDRATFTTNRESLAALVGAIATVESFFNLPGMLPVSPQNLPGKLAMGFASLFAKPAENKRGKPEASRRPNFNAQDDLPPEINPAQAEQFYRNKPDPVLRNSDATLTSAGENELREMLEQRIVDLDPNDFTGKPAEEWSLASHLLDLKSALGHIGYMTFTAVEDKMSVRETPEIVVNSEDVRALSQFKMLENTYLRVCRNEPESKRKNHFLVEQLLLEVQGSKPASLISDYALHHRAGTQNEFLVNTVSHNGHVEIKRPGP